MKPGNTSPHVWMVLFVTLALLLPTSVIFAEDAAIISFNKATAEELMQHEDLEVPEAIAKAIVAYREKNGPFKSPEDLLKVPGITDEIFEDLNPVASEDGSDIIYDPDAEPALAPSKC
jgi:competence protein ComEA